MSKEAKPQPVAEAIVEADKDQNALDEIINDIMGYTSCIETPFGETCSLYADNYTKGKAYYPIEKIINSNVRPFIINQPHIAS